MYEDLVHEHKLDCRHGNQYKPGHKTADSNKTGVSRVSLKSDAGFKTNSILTIQFIFIYKVFVQADKYYQNEINPIVELFKEYRTFDKLGND